MSTEILFSVYFIRVTGSNVLLFVLLLCHFDHSFHFFCLWNMCFQGTEEENEEEEVEEEENEEDEEFSDDNDYTKVYC